MDSQYTDLAYSAGFTDSQICFQSSGFMDSRFALEWTYRIDSRTGYTDS